jgi:hypothetical protein
VEAWIHEFFTSLLHKGEWSASWIGSFYSGYHLTVFSVGPTDGLHTLQKRKFPFLDKNQIQNTSEENTWKKERCSDRKSERITP